MTTVLKLDIVVYFYTVRFSGELTSYSWSLLDTLSGTLSNTTGCTTDVNWTSNGGYLILAAWDSINDCTGYDTLRIPGCCASVITTYEIANTTASAVLSNQAFSSCITTPNTIAGLCSGDDIKISGVFTIDVPLTFLNCDYISLSPNAVIIVDPGQTLTLDNCTLSVKCDTMWDGIHLTAFTSTLNMVNGTVLQQAKNGVVSNSGGRYFIENSTFRNNYRDLQVNAYSGTHPGIVRATDFTMVAPGFWPAIPALSAFETKTICAIEITDNADITIGDASSTANRNRFDNIFVGVRSNNSNTKVINGRFSNFVPTIFQQSNVLDAGTCIVANGRKNYTYQAAITVGGPTILHRCVFTNVRTGVYAYNNLNVTVANNNFTSIRLYGVWVQGAIQRSINITDNNINNSSVSFAFNTGILVLETYDAFVNISRNSVIQTGSPANNFSAQTGTGIRVACVSPADVTVNIFSNNCARLRTGIWAKNLIGKNKVFVNGNTIGFSKPNPAYTIAHYGIRLEGCATVTCDSHTISKSGGNPNLGMVELLRGISIENSPGTIATNNRFKKLGSGLFGRDNSGNSTLACNYMERCFNGVFFSLNFNTGQGCDIGDQVFDPFGVPAATGNQWNNNIAFEQIEGDVLATNPIIWRYDNPLPQNAANNVTLASESYNACGTYFALSPAPIDREKQVGNTLRTAQDTNLSLEQRYQLQRHAHRVLTQNPNWLNLNTPDDSVYQNFYNTYNPSNMGMLRQLELAADTGGYQEVNLLCNSLSCSNQIEHNTKVVYGIYSLTWMQGILKFSSADSASLLAIALQDPVIGGTAVYSAQVMLNLEMDYFSANSQRLAGDQLSSDSATGGLNIYPNPAREAVMLECTILKGQNAQLVIFDLTGKLVLTQQLSPEQNLYRITTSSLEEGMYMMQLVVDGELIENERLVIVK